MFIYISTGVVIAIALTGLSWFLLTFLVQFVFSSNAGFIFAIVTSSIFLVIPTVNHVRMFIALRRHNKVNPAAGAAVTQQQFSVVLRREKKMAQDMAMIGLLLVLSLTPVPLNKITASTSLKLYATLQPWALTMPFLISSINPIIYTWRNKALRDGMKAVVFP